MVVTEPGSLLETFVYHSGKKKYTAAMKSRIGTENKAAMGNPDVNLAKKVFRLSRSCSQ